MIYLLLSVMAFCAFVFVALIIQIRKDSRRNPHDRKQIFIQNEYKR